ncbi:MAG: hypothetical protein OXD47_02260, partial [Gammaproteobacteria bacterium]|nr:hypothetical protein [Gammaproteobacteria bacterium]
MTFKDESDNIQVTAHRVYQPNAFINSMRLPWHIRQGKIILLSHRGKTKEFPFVTHGVPPWTQPYGQPWLCTNSSGTNLDSAAGPSGANYTDVVC